MAKKKKKRTRKWRYRSRESYRAKTEQGRQNQLANLKCGKVRRKGWKVKQLESAGISADAKWIDQYPDDIIGWIEHHFFIKETMKPIGHGKGLLPWQYDSLFLIFYQDVQPSLAVCGSVKKSGKSALAAAVGSWYLTNVKMSENYILSIDLDAGKDVIFSSIKTAIRLHPILQKECRLTKDTIYYKDSFIKVLPCDISVAGLRSNLNLIDECWGMRTEGAIRTLDEVTTNPVKIDGRPNLTLVVTYAGYTEDQNENLHLWRWYQRGKAIEVGTEPPDPAFYFSWKTNYEGVHWVDDKYLNHQRKVLSNFAFLRFHENQWTSAISTFISSDVLDKCFDPYHRQGAAEQDTRICVAIDASTKHDATALIALAKDPNLSRGLMLVEHAIFQPQGVTLNFENTIERTMRLWAKKYHIVQCAFDPYQMVRCAEFLRALHIRMTEFPQSVQNMVSATTTFEELIYSRNLRLYMSNSIRLHILSASTKEHSVGKRIVKTQSTKKIDAAIALAMCCEIASKKFLRRSGRQSTVYTGEDDYDDASKKDAVKPVELPRAMAIDFSNIVSVA